ncbi:MAG TPA: hypothetical protein VGQ53_20695 [Chitinophagaceae bacterium]|jgi:hypothetical protein|nr:hypothetical protein [Chitinophagaceae bacterium]
MKKTSFLAGIASLLLSLSINAQQDSTKPMQQDTTQQSVQQPAQSMQQPAQNQTQTQPTTTVEQKKYGNPTVDSILSKYTLVPMPNPITTEQIFPVIGQYQSTTNADQKITVALDDQNKGFAWVDGLPQGKVKAILKKSPATYKIPAQKTEAGTDVPEGTLIYDKDTKTISIMLGREFNDQDPASVFTNATASTENQSMATNDESKMNDQAKASVTKKGTKTKAKAKVVKKPEPWVFTGTKIEQTTASNQQ